MKANTHTGLGVQVLTGLVAVALLSYTFIKYFEEKYDPEVPVASQVVYQKLSNDDQQIMQKLIPVLNNGLVREQGFWEKRANYIMNKTSQTEFDEIVRLAIDVEKQCVGNGKHVSVVEKPYLDWNPIEISCN